MALAQKQIRKLRARLNPRHIRTRQVDGRTLSYLEGWHVIAEANRIFGFDAWDRELIESSCVYTRQQGERFNAAYTARIRIRVRAGEHMVVREGSGAGESGAPTPGQAHEMAMKAAETDATKRALMTFGNAFGLSLYGPPKEALHNPPPRAETRLAPAPARDAARKVPDSPGPELPEEAAVRNEAGGFHGSDAARKFAPNAQELPAEARHEASVAPASETTLLPTQASTAPDLPAEARHEASVVPVREGTRMQAPGSTVPELPGEAGDTKVPEAAPPAEPAPEAQHPAARVRIDKSALALNEPTRIRDQAHLRRVAARPCLVCGRSRAQAHHLGFAQPKAMGRKASDEFTVALCAQHHRALHETGNEIAWWERQNIDPLRIAAELWRESRAPAALPPLRSAEGAADPKAGS